VLASGLALTSFLRYLAQEIYKASKKDRSFFGADVYRLIEDHQGSMARPLFAIWT